MLSAAEVEIEGGAMSRTRLTLSLVVASAIVATVLRGAASAAVTIIRTPLTGLVINSCAGNESVSIDGVLQEVISSTTDSAGGLHFHSTTNAQNLRGTGLTSGDTYRIAVASHS